jgi:hypothetical protein
MGRKSDPYDDGSDPDPWCTSPEQPDPDEVTDTVSADWTPNYWEGDEA